MIFKNLLTIKSHPRISCPDCAVLMTPFSCEDVIVDRCDKCQGIWFDKKEIAVFRDSLRELPLEEVDVQATIPEDNFAISCCPRCRTLLNEEALGYNAKEKIKKCPKCEGIWMPENQLLIFIRQNKLAKYVEPEVQGIVRATKQAYQRQKETEELLNYYTPFRRPFKIVVPLHDDNPRQTTPWVTSTLIMFCIAMFFLSFNQDLFHQIGLIPAQFQASDLVTWECGRFLGGHAAKV